MEKGIVMGDSFLFHSSYRRNKKDFDEEFDEEFDDLDEDC